MLSQVKRVMSEDIVSKAREIRRRLHNFEVVPEPLFDVLGIIKALTDSLNEFTKAEVVNNESLMRKHAPNVVHNYTVAISGGELKEGAGLFPEYERLRSQLLNCREDNKKTKKEYEELMEQYLILKGRYEELAKIYNAVKQSNR